MLNHRNATQSFSPACACLSTAHNPSFFQPFFQATNSDKLRIPSAFIHNFNGNVPRRISLKSTSGIVWQAKLQIIGNHIYITKGWEIYVKCNSLTNGEVLVFQYLQNATFLVMVFDQDGGIKELNEEPVSKKSGTRQHGSTSTRANFVFEMTFNKKNFVTIPKHIIETCAPKLPQRIILRNEKGRGLWTQLLQTRDRVVMGYFNVSEFTELSNAKAGNRIQFKVNIRDGRKIKDITMTNLSQSTNLGRGY